MWDRAHRDSGWSRLEVPERSGGRAKGRCFPYRSVLWVKKREGHQSVPSFLNLSRFLPVLPGLTSCWRALSRTHSVFGANFLCFVCAGAWPTYLFLDRKGSFMKFILKSHFMEWSAAPASSVKYFAWFFILFCHTNWAFKMRKIREGKLVLTYTHNKLWARERESRSHDIWSVLRAHPFRSGVLCVVAQKHAHTLTKERSLSLSFSLALPYFSSPAQTHTRRLGVVAQFCRPAGAKARENVHFWRENAFHRARSPGAHTFPWKFPLFKQRNKESYLSVCLILVDSTKLAGLIGILFFRVLHIRTWLIHFTHCEPFFRCIWCDAIFSLR